MSATDNPYAPPVAQVADVAFIDQTTDSLRREHIRREASVRLLGSVYMVGGAAGVAMGILFLMLESGLHIAETVPRIPTLYAGLLYTSLSLPAVAIGWGLRQPSPWARIAMVVFTGIGVYYVPSGTILNSYTLYVLFSPRNQPLFEPGYAALVAATPHVKARAPAAVWIIVGVALLGMTAWSNRLLISRLIEAASRNG